MSASQLQNIRKIERMIKEIEKRKKDFFAHLCRWIVEEENVNTYPGTEEAANLEEGFFSIEETLDRLWFQTRGHEAMPSGVPTTRQTESTFLFAHIPTRHPETIEGMELNEVLEALPLSVPTDEAAENTP